MHSLSYKKGIFLVTGLFCLTPWVGPPLALLLGIVTTFLLGQIYNEKSTHQITSWLLKISVVGLGFGMNFYAAIEVGKTGFIFTVLSIFTTFCLGYLLAKKLSVDTKTSILISSGTAICGGSAIAAMSPIIDADNKQVSVALGAIFLLNSIALFLFPFIGHLIHLTQTQFGYWAAIAIHDTSSVVGAAASYGSRALSVATNVKLERALWILPLTFLASFLFESSDQKVRLPFFIILFIVAMLLNTFIPAFSDYFFWVFPAAKKSLTLTLFLIGTSLSLNKMKEVGRRPFLNAIFLWLAISIASLWMILTFK